MLMLIKNQVVYIVYSSFNLEFKTFGFMGRNNENWLFCPYIFLIISKIKLVNPIRLGIVEFLTKVFVLNMEDS